MLRVSARLIGALAIAAVAHPAAAADPPLKTVLERTGRYATEFHRQLSGIVAEETYTQAVRLRSGATAAGGERRELRSDFLLVRAVNGQYVGFRDVFEVDGRPLRGREERLTALVRDPAESARAQIISILSESARYNLGDIERNVNAPTLPLTFLLPDNQWRFKFRHEDKGSRSTATPVPGSTHFAVSTEVWTVSFEEKERPTIVRTPAGAPVPARGRFWIEPATGRVLMSELLLVRRDLSATIQVSYQSEPLLGFLVPIEMRELYDPRGADSVIEGTAAYGRFRPLAPR